MEQPTWCTYPEATEPVWGCWSLLGGYVTGEEYCKKCEMYRKEEEQRMTKQEVLQDIDKLCGDINKLTVIRINAILDRDLVAEKEALHKIISLLISAHQELSFLRDYINDNIKE